MTILFSIVFLVVSFALIFWVNEKVYPKSGVVADSMLEARQTDQLTGGQHE